MARKWNTTKWENYKREKKKKENWKRKSKKYIKDIPIDTHTLKRMKLHHLITLSGIRNYRVVRSALLWILEKTLRFETIFEVFSNSTIPHIITSSFYRWENEAQRGSLTLTRSHSSKKCQSTSTILWTVQEQFFKKENCHKTWILFQVKLI